MRKLPSGTLGRNGIWLWSEAFVSALSSLSAVHSSILPPDLLSNIWREWGLPVGETDGQSKTRGVDRNSGNGEGEEKGKHRLTQQVPESHGPRSMGRAPGQRESREVRSVQGTSLT